MPPRIGMFVHNLNDRGIARVVREVSIGLVEGGADTYVVWTDKEPDIDLGPGVHSVSVPSVRSKSGTILAAGRILRQLQLDAVFAHGDGPARDALLAKALLGLRAQVIPVAHVHYTTHPFRLAWLKRRLVRWLYPKADLVAAVSPGVRDDLLRLCPSLEDKTVVLPNPAPQVAELPIPDHPWYRDDSVEVVISVGHLNPRKAHDVLLKAFRRVHADRPTARLLILGAPDDSGYSGQLASYVRRSSLDDVVEFRSGVNDVLPYLAHADLFVHTARSEAFGLVILEALACGLPVIATDSPGGASWLLDGGKAGILVPVDDHVAIADQIIEVLTSVEDRERLVSSGRDRLVDFSLETVAQRYLSAVAG